jgi:hypothetical protein
LVKQLKEDLAARGEKGLAQAIHLPKSPAEPTWRPKTPPPLVPLRARIEEPLEEALPKLVETAAADIKRARGEGPARVEEAIGVAADALAEAESSAPGPTKAAATKLGVLLNEIDPAHAKALKEALAARGEKALAEAIGVKDSVSASKPVEAPPRKGILEPEPSRAKGATFLPKELTGTSNGTGFRYTSDGARFGESELAATHNRLVQQGYVFLGYRGTTRGFAESQINEGLHKDRIEYRPIDDKWRGLYLAKDPAVCAGYTGDKSAEPKYIHPMRKNPPETTSGDLQNGVVVRVYAPAKLVHGGTVIETSDMSRTAETEKLAAKKLGKPLPADDRLYLIRGPQGGHGKDAEMEEAAIGWKLAEQCVVVPSLVRAENSTLVDGTLTDTERLLDENPKSVVQHRKLPEKTGATAHLASGDAPVRARPRLDPSRGKDVAPSDAPEWVPSGDFANFRDFDLVEHQEQIRSNYPDKLSDGERTQFAYFGVKVPKDATFGDAAAKLFERYQAEPETVKPAFDGLKSATFTSKEWTSFAERLKSGAQPSRIALSGGGSLWLSGHLTAADERWSKQNRVGFSLNCSDDTFPQQKGVHQDQVAVAEFNNGLFEWTSARIDEQLRGGKDGLVHCIEGKNRSATVLAAYLMKKEGLSAEQALKKVVDGRPWATPDLPSLWSWEDYLHARLPGQSHNSADVDQVANAARDEIMLHRPADGEGPSTEFRDSFTHAADRLLEMVKSSPKLAEQAAEKLARELERAEPTLARKVEAELQKRGATALAKAFERV